MHATNLENLLLPLLALIVLSGFAIRRGNIVTASCVNPARADADELMVKFAFNKLPFRLLNEFLEEDVRQLARLEDLASRHLGSELNKKRSPAAMLQFLSNELVELPDDFFDEHVWEKITNELHDLLPVYVSDSVLVLEGLNMLQLQTGSINLFCNLIKFFTKIAIRNIKLTDGHITTIQRHLHPQLTSIALESCNFVFSQAISLLHFHCINCECAVSMLQQLAPNLILLHISGCPNAEGLGEQIRRQEGLQHLDFSNSVTTDPSLIDAIFSLQHLRIVLLSNNRIVKDCLSRLSGHAGIKRWTELDISRNDLSDESFGFLQKLHYLKVLDVTGNLASNAITALSDNIKHLFFLTTLRVDWNNEDDAMDRLLAKVDEIQQYRLSRIAPHLNFKHHDSWENKHSNVSTIKIESSHAQYPSDYFQLQYLTNVNLDCMRISQLLLPRDDSSFPNITSLTLFHMVDASLQSFLNRLVNLKTLKVYPSLIEDVELPVEFLMRNNVEELSITFQQYYSNYESFLNVIRDLPLKKLTIDSYGSNYTHLAKFFAKLSGASFWNSLEYFNIKEVPFAFVIQILETNAMPNLRELSFGIIDYCHEIPTLSQLNNVRILKVETHNYLQPFQHELHSLLKMFPGVTHLNLCLSSDIICSFQLDTMLNLRELSISCRELDFEQLLFSLDKLQMFSKLIINDCLYVLHDA